MSIVLVRVDDRLIHGQVVEGWLPVIQARRIVVASDRASEDPLQRGLMRMAVPDHVALDVLSIEKAAAALKAGEWEKERVMLLVAGIEDLARLTEAGAPVTEVNLGGLHDAPGREMAAPHLALTPAEKIRLSGLIKGGLSVETRSLPGDERRLARDVIPGLG